MIKEFVGQVDLSRVDRRDNVDLTTVSVATRAAIGQPRPAGYAPGTLRYRDAAESRFQIVGVAVINRRTVLAGAGIAASAAAAGFGGYEFLRKPGPGQSAMAGGGKPNILVIVVDQMQAPQWFPDRQRLDALLPNVGRLRNVSVSFESHYAASNMCTPSRGVMTAGLYSHQTGCLFTGEGPSESSLAPRFPTWGTMLREQRYRTWWWGKWHLGQSGDTTPEGLDAHGFSGGTYPSPNGAPNQGLQTNPGIVDQFAWWFETTPAACRGVRLSRWSTPRHLLVAEKSTARRYPALVRVRAGELRDARRSAEAGKAATADRFHELHVPAVDRNADLRGA